MKSIIRSALCAMTLMTGAASAAEFVILNADPAGYGFNDPTPATPVGGNPGTTVGEQRLNVYKRAFDLWGQVIDSSVPIVVYAYWDNLSCTATSGVLGSAGTWSIFRDFPNAPIAAHWYHGALADSLAGQDLDPGNPDIVTRFNARLGSAGCLESSGWYYGLDNNESPSQIDFMSVLMHEVAHGLGFSNFVNESTGQMFAGLAPYYDVYMANTRDNITGKQWDDLTMTNAQRAASGLSIDKMVWSGASVSSNTANVLSPLLRIHFNSPVMADSDIQLASFGAPVSASNLGGDAVYAIDGVGGSTYDACEPIVNGAQLAGKVAVVDRGTCTFVVKVKNAQNAGAVGVLVANNAASGLPGMGGADPTITIPSVGVTQATGNAIKANSGMANFNIVPDPVRLNGSDTARRAKLYAPVPYASGSSGSHFDTTATPNVLMEPAINADLHPATNVDLTAAQFKDIGWKISNFHIGACDAGVPSVMGNGDLLIGPVYQCLDNASNKGDFQSCTTQYLNSLKAKGIISGAAKGSLTSCAAKLK